MRTESTTTTSSTSSPAASRAVSSNGKWEDKIRSQASDLQEQAMEFASTYGKKAVHLVRRYPVECTVGALAAGFLLGAAIRRGKV